PSRPTQISTLSLHDALPISSNVGRLWTIASTTRSIALSFTTPGLVVRLPTSRSGLCRSSRWRHSRSGFLLDPEEVGSGSLPRRLDRKSTRLNSSHDQISYAV